MISKKDLHMFADWVASEVCREDFIDDADFFAEVACRKLVKLGIIKLVDNKYCYENKGDFLLWEE